MVYRFALGCICLTFFFFEKVLMLTIDNYLNGDPICLLVIIAEQYNL